MKKNVFDYIEDAESDPPKFHPVSFGEMSEVVCAWQRHQNPETDCTPEKIFNYSPTGELAMVWFWFLEALEYFLFNADGVIVGAEQ